MSKMPSLLYIYAIIIISVRLELVVASLMNTTRTSFNSTHYDSEEYALESYELDYNNSYYENDTSIGFGFDLYDEQGISDIKVSLFNPLVPLNKMVTVSLINAAFQPYDYALIIRTASHSTCEQVIRVTNSQCKFNLMNLDWYIRLYIRSPATQDLKSDDVHIDKMDKPSSSNITQLNTVCGEWSMFGDCSNTEMFHTYTVCRPVTGASIPFWSPEFIPHSEIFDCSLECSSNCSCTLRDGVLMSSCSYNPGYSTGIVWNAPGQEDYFGVRFQGNIDRIGSNAFVSYSFRQGVVSFLLSSDQSIHILDTDAFSGFSNLSELILSYNGIQVLMNGSFDFLWNLQLLELDWNELEVIGVEAFSHLTNLQELSMRRNKISVLPFGLFSCLQSLIYLNLQYNRIHKLQPGLFMGMSRLETLDLSNNNIYMLQPYTFRGLISLSSLFLNENDIKTLLDAAFVRNRVPFAEGELVAGVSCNGNENNTLHQSGNCQITIPQLPGTINFERFQNNSSVVCPLELIRLTGNHLEEFSFDSFVGLTNASIDVDNDWLCCFLKGSICEVPTRERKTTNFLTCNRLLPNYIARILLWMFSGFALFGNIIVITWQLHLKVFKSVQPFLIANLAVSDLLMGMYMLIIASADIHYGDYFPAKTETWRNSGICLLAGTLSIISSELSMLLVTLISLDRLMGICFTFSKMRLNVKRASVIVTVLWFVSLILGLIPVFAKSSLNYELSEVCVALPLSMKVVYTQTGGTVREGVVEYFYSVTKSGMYYSIAVFIGLNSLCCLVIALCYIWIFITVQMTTRSSGRQRQIKEEIHMAMKMAVIVLTDFCCWVPVIIMGILVQAGIQEIPPVANAWIVTLVMPINSAINPFLYTLSTVISDRYHKTKENWRRRYSVRNTSEIPL